MAIHRTKRPLVRTVETRDARLIIIAAEGEKTEKLYFDSFRNNRLKIITIPSESGRSSPGHVLENVDSFKEAYDLNGDDELWLVLDMDRWPEKSLSEVAQACVSKRLNLAVSNPCFELWPALHCDEDVADDVSPDALRKHLVAFLGSYNKKMFNAEKLLVGLQKAIERAKQLEGNSKGRWPGRPGTHVHKIFDRVAMRHQNNAI